MLNSIDSANVTHSIWCEQVAERDFEYVGCTCGALKDEMLHRMMVRDAMRYRWIRDNRELFGEEISWKDDDIGYAAVYVSAEEMDARIDAMLNPVL